MSTAHTVNWNHALAGNEFEPCLTILQHCISATHCLPCQHLPVLVLVSSLAVVQQRGSRPGCHRVRMAAYRAGTDLRATWHQLMDFWRERQWLDLSGTTCSTCPCQEHDEPYCPPQNIRAGIICTIQSVQEPDFCHVPCLVVVLLYEGDEPFQEGMQEGTCGLRVPEWLETCRLAEWKQEKFAFRPDMIYIKWIGDFVMGQLVVLDHVQGMKRRNWQKFWVMLLVLA